MDDNKAREMAAALREHNAWRRGEGVYGTDTPTPMPHTPKGLGEIIDQAAAVLEELAAKAILGKRLAEAAEKVIDMNLQHAQDEYGDAKKADGWGCVVVLRAALAEWNKLEKMK